MTKKMTFKTLGLLIIIIGLSLFIFLKVIDKSSHRLDFNKMDIETVVKGDIAKIVVASGTINPVNIVKIGAQTSGIIEKLFVDYNSVVEKDEKLAIIDTKTLKEQLKEAEGIMNQRKVNMELQKLTYDRTAELHKNNYIAKAELDSAYTNYKSAQEAYKSGQAGVNRIKIELGYATIKSPTAGTVIERKVSEGQTVASGLTTPELFLIAEDLTKMQIETSISESDISMIKLNQQVSFVVDAYKKRVFKGKIKEIRLNPVVEQTVVIYTVVIEVDNNDNVLLPGMTAYVSILIDSVRDVLKTKNIAFRFKPDEKLLKQLNIVDLTKNKTKLDILKMNRDKTIIYVLKNNNEIKPIIVEKGLADVNYTEILSNEINVGDKIVADYLVKKPKEEGK